MKVYFSRDRNIKPDAILQHGIYRLRLCILSAPNYLPGQPLASVATPDKRTRATDVVGIANGQLEDGDFSLKTGPESPHKHGTPWLLLILID